MNEQRKPRRFDRKRFAAFMEKQGFYIVLLLCIATLVGTAVLTANPPATEPEVLSGPEDDRALILGTSPDALDLSALPTPPSLAAITAEPHPDELALASDEEEPPESASVASSQDDTLADAGTDARDDAKDKPAVDAPDMVPPVPQAATTRFSMDGLVYSATLDEWTTHGGIDYPAPEGEPVVAAAAGTVASARRDELRGNIITLSHDGGYETVYVGLASLSLVREGDAIQAGQTIGHVGSTNALESGDGAHLHFEVWKDGTAVDPAGLLEPLK